MLKPIARAKALYAYAKLVQNPNDLDRVFDIADTEGNEEVYEHNLRKLLVNEQASSAVDDRYRIGHVDLQLLSKLPEHTLGYAYAAFMNENGLTPEAIPAEQAPPTRGRYQVAHLRESHDIWHVLTGFGADLPGEIGVQAFTAAQTGSPLSDALVSAILLNSAMNHDTAAAAALYDALSAGWQIGRASKPLFGARWGQMWERSLDDIRAEFAIVPYERPRKPYRFAA